MPVESNVAGNKFLSKRRCNPHVEFLVYPAEIVQLSLITVSMLLLAWNERGLWKFGSKPSTRCGAGLTPAGIDVSVFGNARKFSTLGSNLLSSTAVVELLSVKMRWNRLAGVRASYKPAEARITVVPWPLGSHAKPRRGCHIARSFGMRVVCGKAGLGFVGCGFHCPSQRKPALTIRLWPSANLSCTKRPSSCCVPR